MFNRTVVSICAAALTLGSLAGCAGTQETDHAQDSRQISEAAYIAGLDRGGVPHPDQAQAVALGRGVCAKFDGGADFISVGLLTAMSTDLTPEQAGYLIGTAVVVFCPQHVDMVKAAAEC